MKSLRAIRSVLAAALLLGALIGVLSESSVAADLTVIDLHYRSADEILPVLRPIAGSDVALSGVDYKLLVRGSAAAVARIREALAVLDRAPRQLLVSVRYGASPQSKESEIGIGARSGNANSQINSSPITVRGGTTTSTASDISTSSVRVLEGNGAHISSGQSVPVVSAILLPSRTDDRTTIGMSYRELTSGFNVLPRINGERVMLDISTQQQRSSDLNSGSATVQNTTTTIAGRLGEWIELGGVTSSISEQRSGIGIANGTQRVTTQSDQRSIAVKVEQVD